VTKKESFDHVGEWLHEIDENRDQEDMLVYLVGNRVDLGEELRQVSHQEALKFLKEKNLNNFYETSAKTGFNVVEIFTALVKQLYLQNKQKIESNVSILRIFYENIERRKLCSLRYDQ
jgi:Ras-related protein Rab-6A